MDCTDAAGLSSWSSGFVIGIVGMLGLGGIAIWISLVLVLRERQPHDADQPD